jgi:hypothetical protein
MMLEYSEKAAVFGTIPTQSVRIENPIAKASPECGTAQGVRWKSLGSSVE